MNKPPQQKRSRDTEKRLLDAAAALVDADGIAALSIAEVVRRAGSSVGSFYNRFGDKDGLLRALHARRLTAVIEALDGLAEPLQGMRRAEAVRLCAEQLVDYYARNTRLMAAFNARAAVDPQAWAENVALHVRLVRRVTTLLASVPGESRHPTPDKALELALHAAFAFLGSLAIYGALDPTLSPFPTAALPAELAQLILGTWEGPCAA